MFLDNFVSRIRSIVQANRSFNVASWIALAATVVMTLGALWVASVGIAGLTGRSDHSHRISPVLGTDLLYMEFQPSWEVLSSTKICPRINLDQPRNDCENVILRDKDGPREDLPFLLADDEIRAVSAQFEGELIFDAEPGWNPFIASLYAMSILGLLVIAFLLSQLWLLLRAVARDAPFTDQVVRRLRVMGFTLIGWELLEPLLWLFLSPKAWDYALVQSGPSMGLELGAMEPGLQPTRMAFGLLLLLLAQVFRRGVSLEQDQRLTV